MKSLEEVSRLKGIETYWCGSYEPWQVSRLEEVSRLKGIETPPWSRHQYRVTQVWKKFPVWRELKLWSHMFYHSLSPWFGRSFPFEGNWNTSSDLFRTKSVAQFGRSFPFEGNWNLYKIRSRNYHSQSLEEVSRLKGIETNEGKVIASLFCVRLEEVSRLKGIETPYGVMLLNRFFFSLEEVSRLKGIETNRWLRNWFNNPKFGRSFPFEGNWNSHTLLQVLGSS